MSFLQSLFGKKRAKFEKIGNVEAICPYCNQTLVKYPSRKTKCPHCGNHIFVRTRPADRKKVLVTEEQAAKIDEQWMIEQGTYEANLAEKSEFQNTKAEFAKKSGREPSDHDVWWSIYNKHLLEHAKERNWGLYRNTRFEMAELLRKENRNSQALDTYIEVSYLDANGPSNVGGLSDPQLLKEFPPFNPDLAFQAPAIIYAIKELCDVLQLSETDIRRKYIEVTTRIQTSMKLPVSPDTAWKEFKKEMQKSRSAPNKKK